MRGNTLAEKLLASEAIDGRTIDRAVLRAIKDHALAEEWRQDVRSETIDIINNGEDQWQRAAAEHNLKACSQGPEEWTPYPEPKPDIEAARRKREAFEAYAKLKERDLFSVTDYPTLFGIVEKAWDKVVAWQDHVEDESEVTLAEFREAEAKAQEARPQLLELSSMLARHYADTKEDEKRHRKAQADSGSPVNLYKLLEDLEEQRAEVA